MTALSTWTLILVALASPVAAKTGDCKQERFERDFTANMFVPSIWIRLTVKRGPAQSNSSTIFISPHGRLTNDATYDIDIDTFDTPYASDVSPREVFNFLRELCGDDFVDKLKPTTHGARRSSTLLHASGQASQGYFAADLNGDGTSDTVALRSSILTVTLRNPDGTGSLSRLGYPVGPDASSGLAADFNGDGNLDLAVTNRGRTPTFGGTTSGTLSIFLGNGDGTFQPAVSYPVSGQPDSLAAADFNGDGKLDIAAVGFSLSPNAVSLMLGAGDGTFGRATSFNVGTGPASIVAADFNNDGNPDLATTNFGSRDVSVLLGKGDGTFQPVVNTPSGTQKGYLGYVDLNHDGNMDLVIADYSSSTLVPMLGNGNGTFKPPVTYLAGTQPESLGIIPLDDGNTALFTMDDVTGDMIMAFASADGSVSTPVLTFVGQRPSAISADDLNGDGKPDVVIVDQNTNNAYVLLSGASGQFASPVAYAVGSPSANPKGSALADLNGDGRLDLLVANPSGSIGVLLNAGNGTFRPAQNFPGGFQPRAIAMGDFNRDGKLDVAIAGFGSTPPNTSNPGTVTVLLGRGDGTFQAPVGVGSFPSLSAFAIVSGDFNGDGIADLAAGISNFANNMQTGSFSVLLGKGDGTFQAPVNYPLGPPATSLSFMTAGDLDGDGRPDMVLFTRDETFEYKISALLSNGDGTFRRAGSAITGFGPSHAVITDLNGDGTPDLVVAHCCGDTDATYLLGNGDGTFQEEVHFLSGPSPTAIAVADFDGDGKPDLAIAGQIDSPPRRGTVVTMLNRIAP